MENYTLAISSLALPASLTFVHRPCHATEKESNKAKERVWFRTISKITESAKRGDIDSQRRKTEG